MTHPVELFLLILRETAKQSRPMTVLNNSPGEVVEMRQGKADPAPTAQLPQNGISEIYGAVHSGVPVYEMMCRNVVCCFVRVR